MTWIRQQDEVLCKHVEHCFLSRKTKKTNFFNWRIKLRSCRLTEAQ